MTASAQAVLDGVRDLLPTLRERADETERLRVVPEASVKELEETGFFKLLQPQALRRLRGRPDRLLHRGARHRLGLRLDRLGLQRRRRAPVAGRAVRRRGAAGRVGRGHHHPAELVVRADRQGHGRRGRLPALRQVELLLRLRPLLVGAARRAGLQRRGPGRRLQDVHGAPRQVHDRRRLAHGRASRHRLQRHRGRRRVHPRGLHAEHGRDRSVPRPGPGAEHLRPLQAAVPLDLHRHHHHADHRHGHGRLRRARRDAAEARACGLPRREGLARPVRRGPDRAGVLRDRRRLGAAGQQHPRGAGARRQGREDPARARG